MYPKCDSVSLRRKRSGQRRASNQRSVMSERRGMPVDLAVSFVKCLVFEESEQVAGAVKAPDPHTLPKHQVC